MESQQDDDEEELFQPNTVGAINEMPQLWNGTHSSAKTPLHSLLFRQKSAGRQNNI